MHARWKPATDSTDVGEPGNCSVRVHRLEEELQEYLTRWAVLYFPGQWKSFDLGSTLEHSAGNPTTRAVEHSVLLRGPGLGVVRLLLDRGGDAEA